MTATENCVLRYPTWIMIEYSSGQIMITCV